MAAPTSAVDVCNLALDRMGQGPIASIDSPTTAVEDVMARWYDATRREVLRKYTFNFARKLAVLTAASSVTPAFGFATAYALPNDFIRLLALGDTTVKADLHTDLYDLSEGYIYTDYGDADGDLNITYIKDATDVNKWDALFLKVMVLQLAANTSYKFTLKPSVRKDIENELEKAEVSAAAVAGQENPPQRIERSRFRDVRRGGYSRDNTRI